MNTDGILSAAGRGECVSTYGSGASGGWLRLAVVWCIGLTAWMWLVFCQVDEAATQVRGGHHITFGKPSSWWVEDDLYRDECPVQWSLIGIPLQRSGHYVEFSARPFQAPIPGFIEVHFSRETLQPCALDICCDGDVLKRVAVPNDVRLGDRVSILVASDDMPKNGFRLGVRLVTEDALQRGPLTQRLGNRDEVFVNVGAESEFWWQGQEVGPVFSAASGIPIEWDRGVLTTRMLPSSNGWLETGAIRIHGLSLHSEMNPIRELAEAIQESPVSAVRETRRTTVTERGVVVTDIEVRNQTDSPQFHRLLFSGSLSGEGEKKVRGRRYFLVDDETIYGFDRTRLDATGLHGLCVGIGFSAPMDAIELTEDHYQASKLVGLQPNSKQVLRLVASFGTSRGEVESLISETLVEDRVFELAQQAWELKTRGTGPSLETVPAVIGQGFELHRSEHFSRLKATEVASVEHPELDTSRGDWYRANGLRDLMWEDTRVSGKSLVEMIREHRSRTEVGHWFKSQQRSGVDLLMGSDVAGGVGSETSEPTMFTELVWLHYLIHRDSRVVDASYDDLVWQANVWLEALSLQPQPALIDSPLDFSVFQSCDSEGSIQESEESRLVAMVHLIRMLECMEHLAGVLQLEDDRSGWRQSRERLLADEALQERIASGVRGESNSCALAHETAIFQSRLSTESQNTWVNHWVLNGGHRSWWTLPMVVAGGSSQSRSELGGGQVNLSHSIAALEGVGWHVRRWQRPQLEAFGERVSRTLEVSASGPCPFAGRWHGENGLPWGAGSGSEPLDWNHLAILEVVGLRLRDNGDVEIDPLPVVEACSFTLPGFRGQPLGIEWSVGEEGGPGRLQVAWGDDVLLVDESFTVGERTVVLPAGLFD